MSILNLTKSSLQRLGLYESLKKLTTLIQSQPKISSRCSFPRAKIIELPEYQAIFISIPKVASSSMLLFCSHLLKLEIPEGSGVHQYFDNHPSLAREDLSANKYANYWKFCFVRNPWDRLVSCYLNKIKDDPDYTRKTFINGVHFTFHRYGLFEAGMSFADFVQAVVTIPDEEADSHFCSQHVFILDEKNEYLVDFIGKFEQIKTDLEVICDRLGVSNFELPHRKKSERQPYQDYYTPGLIELVAERYSRDLELFNYQYEKE